MIQRRISPKVRRSSPMIFASSTATSSWHSRPTTRASTRWPAIRASRHTWRRRTTSSRFSTATTCTLQADPAIISREVSAALAMSGAVCLIRHASPVSRQPVDGGEKPEKETRRVRPPAMSPVRVVYHAGNVIVDQKTGKADHLERPHRLDDVDVSIPDEALGEPGHCALDIAEVDVEDLAT